MSQETPPAGPPGQASSPNASLGDFLRHERQKRGITIEQVASATKINIKTLHSLEADHYHQLPAKPFIRGFVISYSRFVGLDSKLVLNQFADFLDTKQKERPNRESGHSGYAFEKREGEQTRTLLWVVMGGFIVLGALMIIFVKPLRHRHSEHLDKLRASHTEDLVAPVASGVAEVAPSPIPSEVPSPAAEVVAVVSQPKPKASRSPQPSPVPSSTPSVIASISVEETVVTKPSPTAERKEDILNSGKDLLPGEWKYRVKFKALENVFVKYQCDEKPFMKFVLKQDKELVLKARTTIKFQTTNSKAITYEIGKQGARVLNGDSRVVMRGNNATLFFPPELSETIQDPFPGQSTSVPQKTGDKPASDSH